MAERAPHAGGRVDLHTHTVFSDGTLPPAALVDLANRTGLAAIAITDHDSMEGVRPAQDAAGVSLEVVPGIEISTTMEARDLHVLGYFVSPTHADLVARLNRFREERIARVHAIVARLADLGIDLSPEVVLGAAGPGVVGRPHVATALVQAGHVENLEDAFARYLGARGPAYVARPAFHPREAIALIQAAGGVSVLAHPGARTADATVEELAEVGLDGIEVWHPQHGHAQIRRYRALAARLSLLETGGSDFHGPDRGVPLGDLPVPVAALRRLKEAAGVPG